MANQAEQKTPNTGLEEITKLSVNVEYIKRDVKEIKDKIASEYITRAEFEPIKKVVYGLVGLILVAVVTAILAIVIKA